MIKDGTMAKSTRIGETIPKGVIDTASGSVGEQKPMSQAKQIQHLRRELSDLRQKIKDAGYDVDISSDQVNRRISVLLYGAAAAAAAFAVLWAAQHSRSVSSRSSVIDAILAEIARKWPSHLAQRSKAPGSNFMPTRLW
jgi:hypothetical protein